ncbi:MAG: hypothetical protein Q4B69_02385 [Slackia sp.]|nr:hypothetical protein [Slackia sp.]
MPDESVDFDVLITIRDMSDEEAGVDDVLLGCALRKDVLPAFLADVAKLAHSYGGKDFGELAESDDDSVLDAAHRRWLSDAAPDEAERA